jgi:hypothetical protein
MRAARYFMEYRTHYYCLADAFRPDPMWGKRRFSVPAEKVGAAPDHELIEAAEQTAPEGYRLARLWEVGPGGERDIYFAKVPTCRPTTATEDDE